MDEREDAQRPPHGHEGEERGLGRHLQRERLRHELADDHRQGRQEEEHGHRGGGVRRGRVEPAESFDPRRERRRECGLAVGAENQARERDADLRGGDVPIELVRILDERKQARRQRASVLGEAPQPAATHADGRELSSHVEGREQNQQDDDRPRQEHAGWIVLQKPQKRLSRQQLRSAQNDTTIIQP